MLQETLPGIFGEFGNPRFRFDDSPMNDDLSPQLCNQALLRWLEAESRARILLSSDMTVRWMSNEARSLVEAGDIRVQDGRLVPRSQTVTELFANCVTDESTCALWLDPEQRTWVVWARRLATLPNSLIGVIYNPPRHTTRFSALVDTHTLTPSEGRVVEMLLNGLETGRIAQTLNVSNETLKTHLKHIYCKMNVKSRGELFAQAVGFATP
jgi:DNA-binding CsgD family transcriptional regulator